MPEGEVIATDPAGGAEVRKGGKVTVSVSLGIRMVEVPPLVDTTREAAEAALAEADLPAPEVRPEYHDTVPAGTVLFSTPAAGEVVPHSTVVELVVSAGREPVELPDVAGAAQGDAVAALERAGLVAGALTQEFSDTVAAGVVISQSPAPGAAQLYRGDAVALVVSKGPELFAVPNVFGDQVPTARQKLEGLGFRVKVNEVLGGLFGTVRAQDPEAGTMLPRNGVVTLTVV
ncbi:PASTA domain-containing protein [Georgenia yuyongxinii]